MRLVLAAEIVNVLSAPIFLHGYRRSLYYHKIFTAHEPEHIVKRQSSSTPLRELFMSDILFRQTDVITSGSGVHSKRTILYIQLIKMLIESTDNK